MFTLVPGGAFIMCESVEDFDGNVQPQTQVDPASRLASAETADIVTNTKIKLQGPYEKYVSPLLTMSYGYTMDDDESFGMSYMSKLDQITAAATASTNAIIKIIGELSGVLKLAYADTSYVTTSFDAIRGLVMRKVSQLEYAGYGHYEYTYSTIPQLQYLDEVRKLMGIMNKCPEMLDSIIGFDQAGIITSCDGPLTFFEVFPSILDLMSCIFGDPARLIRFESNRSRDISLRNLLSPDSLGSSACDGCAGNCVDAQMSCQFVESASKYLRCTMQKAYDLQCAVADGKDVDSAIVSALLARTVNVYGFGVILAMHYAYQLREYYSLKNAIDNYSRDLITALKSV